MSSSEADVRSIPPATRHRMPGTACMDRNSIEPMETASIGPGGLSGEVLGEGAAVPGACERRTVPTRAGQSRKAGPRKRCSLSCPCATKPTRDGQSRTVGIPRLAVAHLGFAELASRAAPRHECDPARLHQSLPLRGLGVADAFSASRRCAGGATGRFRGGPPRVVTNANGFQERSACRRLEGGPQALEVHASVID